MDEFQIANDEIRKAINGIEGSDDILLEIADKTNNTIIRPNEKLIGIEDALESISDIIEINNLLGLDSNLAKLLSVNSAINAGTQIVYHLDDFSNLEKLDIATPLMSTAADILSNLLQYIGNGNAFGFELKFNSEIADDGNQYFIISLSRGV